MLYLIESGDYYKIGYTKNIELRLKNYATENPSVKLLALKEGSIYDETQLHKICKKYTYKNEWMFKNSAIIDIFNKYNSTLFDINNNPVVICDLGIISEIVRLEGNYIRVLMYCWKFSTFNPAVEDGNIIYNNKLFKNKIRENGCNLSDPVIDKAFHVLTSNGFLIKKCRATYMLNPEYFFRGNLTSRSKIIRSIALNCDPIMKNK